MLLSTTENNAGHRTVETKGTRFGVVVRNRGLGGNIAAGLRSRALQTRDAATAARSRLGRNQRALPRSRHRLLGLGLFQARDRRA